MIEIGKYNTLQILREAPMGLILGDDEGGEVLLPGKWVPALAPGQDTLNVFVYQDHQHRPIATTMRPYITLHTFALLRVKQETELGAFLDWGLEKDLFVPFREMEVPMKEGKSYIVCLYRDPINGRLLASSKRRRFLDHETVTALPGEEAVVLICERTDIGMVVIVNDAHLGILYFDELFQPVRLGDRLRAWVKEVRPDGRLDMSLTPLGVSKLEPSAEKVLEKMRKNGGFLALTDASSPEEIRWELGMSKKTFKAAVGVLYKARKIRIEEDGLHSTE